MNTVAVSFLAIGAMLASTPKFECIGIWLLLAATMIMAMMAIVALVPTPEANCYEQLLLRARNKRPTTLDQDLLSALEKALMSK